jgi:hypothetical protein
MTKLIFLVTHESSGNESCRVGEAKRSKPHVTRGGACTLDAGHAF